MKWKLLSTGVLSANALMLALAPTPSFAQDGASSEEIIVTARRREESAQDVPVSVTTFGAAEIERSGFNDFQDYATQVPNLSFAYTNSVGPRAQSIAIRGVFGSDTTGLYLDETPLPGSVDPRVVDLERIEVLRGPQGTLYGARSMGGTVRLLTRWAPQERLRTWSVRFLAITPVNAKLTLTGRVEEIFDQGGERVARIKLAVTTQSGVQTIAGEALVQL